jgi:hypothetical protein
MIESMPPSTRKSGGESIFHEATYAKFWLSRALSTLSFQMSAVAVGWQVYEISHSTFALGMVGLVEPASASTQLHTFIYALWYTNTT